MVGGDFDSAGQLANSLPDCSTQRERKLCGLLFFFNKISDVCALQNNWNWLDQYGNAENTMSTRIPSASDFKFSATRSFLGLHE